MPSIVVPLQAILYQFFVLLLAIALEAFILQKQLSISPRKGVEYAASINLLSVTLGWLVFFNLEQLLPEAIRIRLIVYVFFDRIPHLEESFVELVLIGIVIFFGTFFVKTLGLYLVQTLLVVQTSNESDEGITFSQILRGYKLPVRLAASEASAVLLANACSYSAVLIVLVARWYWINFVAN